jgi:DNA-binding beta-propeller fold protein YncE
MNRISRSYPAGLASAAALLIVTGVAASQTSIPGAGGTIFVTERQFGSVTAFDAATGAPLWTGKTGLSPIGVTSPHGTDRVYTSDEGSNQMTVLDAITGAPLRSIAMGPLPHHLMASSNGKLVYVAEFGHNEIGVVDTNIDVRVAGFVASEVPNARTHAVWIARDGKDLYATNSRFPRTEVGDVAKLDAVTGDLLCNTIVGVDPSEVLVTPDSHTAYVSVRGENKVKELDLTGECPVLTGREALVGTLPDTLQLTNDGSTLVVALRGTPAQISFLDTRTFAATIVLIPGHTTTGHHWLSANGKYSFVAVENPAGVAVVDNGSAQTLDVFLYPNPPGGSRAHGVFHIPGR